MTRRLIVTGFIVVFLSLCLWGSATADDRSRDKSTKTLSDLSESFKTLSEDVSRAVVQIYAAGYGPPQEGRSGTSGLIGKHRAKGSGVILHPDGYIMTNGHVVSDARRVQVILSIPTKGKESASSILKPSGEQIGAQIIGIDRETDLALLKVPRKDLPYLELADSDELYAGQIVLAFGSPLGLENSVSMGVVSAVARQLRPEDPMIYIQTDASINPGNSGGPLVDVEGRVIGINTLIFSHAGGSEGIGFAAPSNIVKTIFNQLRASGRVRRGHIGVKAQTITPTMAVGLGLDRDWGVILGDIYPGGPAAMAGLEIGDIVLSLDGKQMENGRQLEVNLYRRPIGEKVSLDILRGSDKRTVRVTVVEREDTYTRFSDLVNPEENLIRRLGILCLDINNTIRKAMPHIRRDYGVVVAARAADAPYQADGLRAGDIIYSMNRTRVVDLRSLRVEADKLRIGDSVVCHVERDGQLMFVAFVMDL